MEWMKALNDSIEFMENHLLDDISVKDVADSVYMSSYYYQKGFQILAGYSVMEYIRSRRLFLAGQMIAYGNEKVIDIALKYGYDSPDSFSKAFSRFHGMTPMQAKKTPWNLKIFNRLQVKIVLEGGSELEYRVEKKKAFKVLGTKRTFQFDSSYENIPKFWDEYMESIKGKENPPVWDMFGICNDSIKDSKQFEYYIAGVYEGKEVPDGFEVLEVPETTWIVFPCQGPLPGSLQNVNTKIYSEWMPAHTEYEFGGDISVEMYTKGNSSLPDYKSEIWIRVKEK